ncbi:MAG: ABC transporter permease [Bacilli bacterium]
MYILKNAYTNVIRTKGRNILIGIIITTITLAACIALTINKSGNALVQSYKDTNPLTVSFSLSQGTLRDATTEEKESFVTYTIDDLISYGDSSYIKDYYYTYETTVNSDTIEAVSYDDILTVPEDSEQTETQTDANRPSMGGSGMNVGDFRLTGYSDPAYITNFIDSTNKIIEGSMFTKDNTDLVVVISSDLADANELTIGSTITVYSSSDDTTTYDLEVIGIYEDTSDTTSDSFMNMNAMNSSNQIYTNITTAKLIYDSSSSSTSTRTISNGLNAYYYLNSNDDLEAFEAEVYEKGLNSYYTISTNEEELLESLTPISNLSSFSFSFLIIILIVGSLILSIINMINIRERKYEIGVLRAIGMSKSKVAIQLVAEIFIVALVSLVIGTGLGTILSQPATNMVLANEISSYENKSTTTEQNFGGEGFDRAGFQGKSNPNSANTDYIETLDVQMDIITILQLFVVSIALTTISGLISVMFVSKYEPNKILQNRS